MQALTKLFTKQGSLIVSRTQLRCQVHHGERVCITCQASVMSSVLFRYLSTLYSHPDFPHDPDVIDRVAAEIRTCVEKHWQVHLSPPWSSRYLRKIIGKSVQGQPVSFTDFYGYLVGQQLLKGVGMRIGVENSGHNSTVHFQRMKARLSHQEDKIFCGLAPMPLYTCLHVKSNVSAKVFQVFDQIIPNSCHFSSLL